MGRRSLERAYAVGSPLACRIKCSLLHVSRLPNLVLGIGGKATSAILHGFCYGARIVAEAIAVECVTVTEDPFSLLSYAQLVLRASTVPLAVETDTGRIGLRLHETVIFPQIVGLDRRETVYGLKPLPRSRSADEIPDEDRHGGPQSTSTSEDNVTTSEPVLWRPLSGPMLIDWTRAGQYSLLAGYYSNLYKTSSMVSCHQYIAVLGCLSASDGKYLLLACHCIKTCLVSASIRWVKVYRLILRSTLTLRHVWRN